MHFSSERTRTDGLRCSGCQADHPAGPGKRFIEVVKENWKLAGFNGGKQLAVEPLKGGARRRSIATQSQPSCVLISEWSTSSGGWSASGRQGPFPSAETDTRIYSPLINPQKIFNGRSKLIFDRSFIYM